MPECFGVATGIPALRQGPASVCGFLLRELIWLGCEPCHQQLAALVMFLLPLQTWEGVRIVWVTGHSLLEALEADWFLVMPGGRRGPSRQQLSRSALPSLQTLVGGSCGNGTGLRNR